MDAAALFVQPPATNLLCAGAQAVLAATSASACCSIDKEHHQQHILPSPDNNMSAVLTRLQSEFGQYKYTVYRCASKLVALQRIFHTAKIPYKLVLVILERYGMNADADYNMMVPPFQLTSLLHDIYFASEKLGDLLKNNTYQLEAATALLANFFWNNFDPHRRHSISLLELKVTFVLLCKLYNSEQLVSEFYALLADAKTKCVTKFSFEYFLNILFNLLTYIGEGKAYGAHNQLQILEQVYARCHNGSSSSGLTEYQFHCLWSTTQTRFLIYANLLSLVERIEDTAHLIHTNACSSCRIEHIIGIRFKCQVCREVSLCLCCFASGYVTSKHIATHRMCEVFGEDQPAKKFSHYFARLCTFFGYQPNCSTSEEERTGFCKAQEKTKGISGESEMVNIPAESRSVRTASTTTTTVSLRTAVSNNMKSVTLPKQNQSLKQLAQQQHELPSLTGLTTTATNASEHLQAIIDRLLQQNSKLEAQLQTVQTATREEIDVFLIAHQTFLVDIINEMRSLSHSPTTTPITATAYHLTSSTPHRNDSEKQLALYQPITVTPTGNYAEHMKSTYDAELTHSLNGADLNRSYLEANKSDYSLNDLSLWFDQRKKSLSLTAATDVVPSDIVVLPKLKALPKTDVLMCGPNGGVDRDSDMLNFKILLHKVKEIVDDSYSDNAELSAATQNLENVLDSIIKSEEKQRHRSSSSGSST